MKFVIIIVTVVICFQIKKKHCITAWEATIPKKFFPEMLISNNIGLQMEKRNKIYLAFG